MHVCLCAVSPVALCSYGPVVRLTVCESEVVRLTVYESDDLSSNPAQCSFSSIALFFLSLLAQADIVQPN